MFGNSEFLVQGRCGAAELLLQDEEGSVAAQQEGAGQQQRLRQGGKGSQQSGPQRPERPVQLKQYKRCKGEDRPGPARPLLHLEHRLALYTARRGDVL